MKRRPSFQLVRPKKIPVVNRLYKTMSHPQLVRLTPKEEQIFEVLTGTIKRYQLGGTIVRVAGGWVRDKLLGRESHDIDLALNNCTGKNFAEYVNRYLQEMGEKTNKIGVICANPDQSKHLETAKVKVLGQELDFVNLRAETYEDSSRIPEMRFGTALEDALRRDFTINSLFYNVNEKTVEDFTGVGLQDIKLGIIRTPLPSCETFKDDPLRILRAIRFATRFAFEIDEDIMHSAQKVEISQALSNKVSRERIGVELKEMLDSKQPLRALQLVLSFGLVAIVFRIPLDALPKVEPDPDSGATTYQESGFEDGEDWGHEGIRIVSNLTVQMEEELSSMRCLPANDVVYLSAMLQPLYGKTVRNLKGRKEATIVTVIRDSLKLRMSLANDVLNVNKGCHVFAEIMNGKEHKTPGPELRLKLGKLIREIKGLWSLSLLLAVASQADIIAAAKSMKEIEGLIHQWNLTKFYSLKSLIDGKGIMQIKSIKGGPRLGILMEQLWDWRILNPTGSKDECLEYLKTLPIPPIEAQTTKSKKPQKKKKKQ